MFRIVFLAALILSPLWVSNAAPLDLDELTDDWLADMGAAILLDAPSPARVPGSVGNYGSGTIRSVNPSVATSAPAGSSSINATRIFSGPTDYPPDDFAAYGIVAFPGAAISQERNRYIMICEAYVAIVPNAMDVITPLSEQMVTVWPVNSDQLGNELTLESSQPCDRAVSSYDTQAGGMALRDAMRTGVNIGVDRGPYLLAWSPGRHRGTQDAAVLRLNMSYVETYAQATDVFRRWVRDIEERPELWNNGWSIDSIRLIIRNWADDIGADIAGIGG
ncbi:MAG: hypothetical protein ACK5IP_20880 [Paracoccus sp. (in: a-proteobacteria)]